MIDLTPLDVRKKKGDFSRTLRGYDPDVVDGFLDMVADRLEEVVRENVMLKERTSNLADTVNGFREREQAMNEALVSAQQLREELRAQAARDSEIVLREARSQADRVRAEAAAEASAKLEGLKRVESQRQKYLRSFRALVERQLAEIEMEEERLKDARTAAAEEKTERGAA
jgi:cell division initiation protein